MVTIKGRKHGFTLIELLVVIAIIALLAAILFPIYARAKEAGKRASCLNNLKQIGTAAHLYADIWNDHYPPGRPAGIWPMGNFDPPNEGIRPLEKYVKSVSVFYCPNHKQWNRYDDWGIGKHHYIGYAWWANYLHHGLTEKDVATKASQYPRSILCNDIMITHPNGRTHKWTNHTQGDLQGGNNLYNDGHAKWVHFKELTNHKTTGGYANIPELVFHW